MVQSRDEVRQVYLTVWNKMRQRLLLEPMESLIAEVIGIHPEYHTLLDTGEDIRQRDFTPEQGQTNPFLHMGMHIALREQASADRPAGIKSVYDGLVADRGRHEAEHAMMECLGQSLWNAQRNKQTPDEAAYLECLKKLSR
ncbi:MAG: DUF1841 family protein [Gammaproteobacteria bacterium]|nr:DUF1841 family protein [Gammaproteobacteria bacterium]MDH3534991.1 DUF1841 family protein [Gammaproteobacteria bacterium]